MLALLWCALRCGGNNASISLAAAVVAAVGRFATEKVPRAVAAKIALSLPLSVRLRVRPPLRGYFLEISPPQTQHNVHPPALDDQMYRDRHKGVAVC